MPNRTYDILYDAHLYFPCRNMPRFGYHGTLTTQQIKDVTAYLLAPDSPVNQEPNSTAAR